MPNLFAAKTLPLMTAMACSLCFAPAHADASLDYTVSAECTIVGPGPAGGQPIACDASGWTVFLQPQSAAQMTVTVNYRYHDDGLPLEQPSLLPTGPGGTSQAITHEAASLIFETPGQNAGADHLYIHNTGGGLAFLSANNVPDDASGTLTFLIGALTRPGNPNATAWSANLYFHPEATVASVAAIPEPSTVAMMVLPLGFIGVIASRRRRLARPA